MFPLVYLLVGISDQITVLSCLTSLVSILAQHTASFLVPVRRLCTTLSAFVSNQDECLLHLTQHPVLIFDSENHHAILLHLSKGVQDRAFNYTQFHFQHQRVGS